MNYYWAIIVLATVKAERLGRESEGDSEGSLSLYGEPAVCQFQGLAGFGLVHDEIEDGCEIMWELDRVKQRMAGAMVRSNEELLAG